jgi:hypothetical protein
VLGFIDRQSTGTSSLNHDARLRVYNIIPCSAPIVKACRTGDIASARNLFAIGQASPYDVAIGTRVHTILGYATLLNLAIHSWRSTVLYINESKFSDDISDEIEILKRKFGLFSFLVDCGLDPGEQMASLPKKSLQSSEIGLFKPT